MRIKSERDAADNRGNDYVDWRDVEEINQAYRGNGEDGGFPANLGVQEHLDRRREDERHNTRTDAVEDALDHRICLVIEEKHRDKQDYHYGWDDGAETGRNGTPHAFDLVAGVECGVDGEDAWKHLHYRDHVPEFVLLNPLALVDNGLLDHVEHGITATESERPDVEEGEEKLKHYTHF